MDTQVLEKTDNAFGEQTGELLQLVSFNIGSEEFGVDILKVQEINRMVEITRVPQAPHYVEGVINLRGKVIPIVDLRKRFNLEVKEYDKNTRIVVVDISGNIMGMVVDSVSEVLRLPSNTIEPPPEIVASINSEYIKGVAKLEDRLLIFLDLSKVIDVSEMSGITA
ncbi:MAG: chemotaxis protein CheW [candidate division Zixibacteria bacterium]|nr:chemotaxis protein CheW [candidate division Zixibacteria bacterium]MDH3937790.1 chemotaxis protein CheW [candidate division Zixibacteria bacterium]MDH4034865.1 chemotaxis protein CheW [candidate division Zixibacteria bacterium]